MIELRNISAWYGKTLVLDNISLGIGNTGLTVLLGANGCGKTTLLSLMAGLPDIHLKASSFPLINGKPSVSLPAHERANLISFAAQHESCAWRYTVAQYAELSRFARGENQEAVQNALDTMQLSALAHRPVTQLSGGEFQRAVMARVLAQDTPFVLLDEPAASLDIQHQYALMETLHALAQKKAVVVSMHDINMASLFSDRIVLMKSGKIIMHGKAEEVITSENLHTAYEIDAKVFLHPTRKRVQILL